MKYGDKRNYRKIDFFNFKGGYICTTTWSKNLKEALNHFYDDGLYMEGTNHTITAKYQGSNRGLTINLKK